MPEIIIIPVGFDIKPKEDYCEECVSPMVWCLCKPEPDYSRELGLACWCNDAEQCQNDEH